MGTKPDSTLSKVPPQYVVNRQGKDFVLFTGLLELGHKAGIKRMASALVQAPLKENGMLAIVQCTLEFDDGRVFSSIGDASPENVGRMIAPHITRMAETRGYARALRNGLNIGGTALEELGPNGEGEGMDDDAPNQRPHDQGQPAMPAPPQRPQQQAPQAPANVNPATGEVGDDWEATKAVYEELLALKKEIHQVTGKEVAIPEEAHLKEMEATRDDWKARLAAYKAKKQAVAVGGK